MAAKRKFSLDMGRITSGVDIGETVKSMNESENIRTSESQELRTFKKVPFRKLKSSPLNDYPIIAVEEMENLLLAYGLLEPLSVSYNEDEDTYEIESGDRRFHALQNLYTKYEEEFVEENKELYEKNVKSLFVKGISCMVENGPSDNDNKRSRIIVHNETSRPFDPIRTSSRLAELAEIYSRQNASLPTGEKINVNEKIARELNGKYGVRQIIRYKNFDSLIDELKEVAVKYNMNISTVSTYHVLSELEQSVLVQYIETCYNSGQSIELPSVGKIKSIVASEHIEEQESGSTSSTPINERPDAHKTIDEPSNSNDESMAIVKPDNSLSDLKDRAARKILEEKDKKESKIKDTVGSLQKKSSQLEKIIMTYITEEENPHLNLEELLTELDEITAKIDSIKQTLKK